MTGLPLLSLLIALPLVAAGLLLFVDKRDGTRDGLVRGVGLGVVAARVRLTLGLWAGFDPSATAPSSSSSSGTPGFRRSASTTTWVSTASACS